MFNTDATDILSSVLETGDLTSFVCENEDELSNIMDLGAYERVCLAFGVEEYDDADLMHGQFGNPETLFWTLNNKTITYQTENGLILMEENSI